MNLRLDPRAATFTIFLGILAALSSLSLDPFIPALPTLAREFGASVTTVQGTVTVFFTGLACGQLFYGPVSDHYGRRPLLLIGSALFVIATLYCAYAPSIEALIVGRFFQALGASSGTVLGRSIVRDLYSWEDAAQKLALIWLVFGIMPLVGPLAGAGLLALWNWQAIFWFMLVLTLPVFAAIVFSLPETSPRGRGPGPTPMGLARNYGHLLRQRHFQLYLAMILLCQIGIFAFVANSSFVLIGALGFSVTEFGFVSAGVMAGHVLGAAVGRAQVRKIGIVATVRRGALLAAASGITIMAVAWLRIDAALAITVPMFCFMFGAAFITPNAMAAAMSPYPKIAGAASSLIGLAQLTAGAGISYVLGVLFDATARPFATAIALSGVSCVLLQETLIRRHGAPAMQGA